ncbi:F-box domain-containing protein [Heracleum sosnowskyi]|uniref:F-box domain-containing protein n=1 Tax=Heracleum sosnowskyi TaxID=360622 RepID=A0AAD8MG63_9APIA|nr:F-box domain-containing protein [Heracleum sosnowskyi]
MAIARLLHNQSSDHSGHVKRLEHTSDLIFSNMDLLTSILVRLPLRKLMQFKCVSKSWLSLIKTPHFLSLRSQVPFHPPSGLFVQQHFSICNIIDDPVFYFRERDVYNDSGEIRKLPTFCNDLFACGGNCGTFTCGCGGLRRIRILDSSNGLLLCCNSYYAEEEKHKQYIYNPTTNQLLATLPRLTDQNYVCTWSMTLVFCPSNSPHYKVIACALRRQIKSKSRQFEIYSSETKSWRVAGQPFPYSDGILFMNGVYCNGSVYWLSKLYSDVNSADCLYFNLNEERLEKFPKPPIRLTLSTIRNSYFGESDNHLHFIEVSLHSTSFHVYELKRDHSGWFVKYHVNLAQLSKAYPQMINNIHDRNNYKVAVLSLVRRDRFVEDDSFLVLDVPGKVMRYNLVKRNSEEICDYKVLVDQHARNIMRFGGLQVWQYVECHSSV